mmetsp:Transcript_55646/g.158472  ORF Transcript_55646/g.158472 Transcript_55646/m.158472 type:complete len:272 (+) Transcript_55646:877-1692(+)
MEDPVGQRSAPLAAGAAVAEEGRGHLISPQREPEQEPPSVEAHGEVSPQSAARARAAGDGHLAYCAAGAAVRLGVEPHPLGGGGHVEAEASVFWVGRLAQDRDADPRLQHAFRHRYGPLCGLVVKAVDGAPVLGRVVERYVATRTLRPAHHDRYDAGFPTHHHLLRNDRERPGLVVVEDDDFHPRDPELGLRKLPRRAGRHHERRRERSRPAAPGGRAGALRGGPGRRACRDSQARAPGQTAVPGVPGALARVPLRRLWHLQPHVVELHEE